jgi:hypothetical protein
VLGTKELWYIRREVERRESAYAGRRGWFSRESEWRYALDTTHAERALLETEYRFYGLMSLAMLRLIKASKHPRGKKSLYDAITVVETMVLTQENRK